VTPFARKQTLLRRRHINPYRQLTVKVLDEAKALLQYTCKTCGHVFEDVLKNRITKKPMSPEQVRMLTRLWTKAYGATTGHCPRCTKAARDEAAPL
jgi:hypothetical protein